MDYKKAERKITTSGQPSLPYFAMLTIVFMVYTPFHFLYLLIILLYFVQKS